MWLAPSEIYYSQDSISNRFGKSTEHAGVLIGETLDDILSGDCSIDDIGTIEVVYRLHIGGQPKAVDFQET